MTIEPLQVKRQQKCLLMDILFGTILAFSNGMSVNNVTNTDQTSQTSNAQYLTNAKDQYDELSTLLNSFTESSSARYVSNELTQNLKSALENLKNLIDSSAEEAFIEELLSKLIALIRGNAQAGIMSIADRASFLSQLGRDFAAYSGRSSEVTGNYNAIVAILNSDQTITSTQANNLRQALSLSIDLENFSSTQHNIDPSLIQALRQGVQEVIGAKGDHVQDKLKQLSDIIHGNSEGAIGLAQRSTYMGELTSNYDASKNGLKLESSYKNLADSLNGLNVLTANDARAFVDMLNGLDSSYQQLNYATKRKEQQVLSLSTKVFMESNRYKELEIEIKASEALLKQESNPQLKRLREGGILGNRMPAREELIRQESMQNEKIAAERLAQSIKEAQPKEKDA
ncbi:MAG: hypothetical protein LBE99_03100 [Puniceicoccales bacterium]|jgi:hypothetical protein|nr:hypothetical protein [Puniceicoccales bacterium]